MWRWGNAKWESVFVQNSLLQTACTVVECFWDDTQERIITSKYVHTYVHTYINGILNSTLITENTVFKSVVQLSVKCTTKNDLRQSLKWMTSVMLWSTHCLYSHCINNPDTQVNSRPLLNYERLARSWSWFLGSQPAWDLASCHYFPPGQQLLSQPKRSPPWLVPNYTAWWQRYTGVSSLPKATMQWCTAKTRTHNL